MAVENNLNVRVSKIDEDVRKRDVEAARGIFDPSLNLGTTYAKNREPTASILYVPGVTTIGLNKFETLSYYGSISGTHLLGTRYELRVAQSERDNPTVNKTFTLLNPIAQTQVTAALRQPLLKGAWYTVNTADVRIAENTARLAREQLELVVIDTVFRVEEAYWNLLFATKNLEAKEKTLEVTLANLENVRRKRQVGTLAAIDVTTAESQVALRRAEVEEAKLLAENARDELLNLVNYTGDRSLKELWEDGTRRLPFDEIQLNPTTPPEFAGPPADRHEALSLAFSRRPEYRQLDLNLLNDEIRLSVAKNALLPSLDVIGQWTQAGLQDSLAESWDELGTGRYYSWFAGVEFSIPIPNRGPRNAYRNAQDSIRRTRLQRMDLENRIVLEVDAAIRTIASLRRKVAELEERVRLQSELLQAERVKLEAGKSIPYTVSVIENDLVADQTNALRANADLQRAIAEFHRATGTLLERHRIQVVSD
ncbi:MAG: TolC family protein [Planctomycetota bacterium]